jgi:hypothetical protein
LVALVISGKCKGVSEGNISEVKKLNIGFISAGELLPSASNSEQIEQVGWFSKFQPT